MTVAYGKLVIYLQNRVYRVLPLTGTTVTIGRLPDNGLMLDSQQVSRRHAEIRSDAQGPILIDVGSSNGTRVNGEPLLPDQPRRLAPGDRVQIGPFILEYQPAAQQPEDDVPPVSGVAPEPVAAESPASPPEPEPDTREEPPPEPDTSEEREPEPPAGEAPTSEPDELPGSAPEQLVAPSAEAMHVPAGPRLPMHDEHTGTAAFRRPVSRYLYDLPVLFHDNEFLGRYLAIFESLWEPLEQRQDHIEMYLDPQTCPATFLHWLAGWFGLALNQRWPEARQRRLLAEATELYRWRGTRYGLTRMIEVCTGLTPTITDQAEAGPGGTPQPFVFHIRLHIPPNSGLDRTFIEDIIQTHKPAHAGYMLEIEP